MNSIAQRHRIKVDLQRVKGAASVLFSTSIPRTIAMLPPLNSGAQAKHQQCYVELFRAIGLQDFGVATKEM